MNVVVVGAGLSGLSAALHLRGAGHRVTVLERELEPGGRNGVLRQDGFTFDTGPTVFTMTDLLDNAFKAVGRRARDYVTFELLDPVYHASFADGSRLRVWHDQDAMRAEIARECGSLDAAAYEEFVVWLRKLFLAEMDAFIDTNFDSPAGLLRHPGAALHLLRLGGFGRLGAEVNRRFKDERLRRVFSFQAMYAGLAPAQALALYAVITYMDSVEGVWFPKGGMHAVPAAMASAATDAGVDIRYGTSATRLRRGPGGAVHAVDTDAGDSVSAEAVVITLDLPTAYERLLPELSPPRSVTRGNYSPSALVWHAGVRGAVPPWAAHHNIHFGEQWDDAFTDLLRRGRPMSDPSRFVCVPSVRDEAAAPEGCSSLYVLEPVPNLRVGSGIDWDAEGLRLRERLHSFLADAGYPHDIVTEQLVTPVDWQRQGMAAGTPFALAHTFAQTGPFRPSNIERRAPGVVFAGSGTVPGVGIPMVLISGRLAALRVEELRP